MKIEPISTPTPTDTGGARKAKVATLVAENMTIEGGIAGTVNLRTRLPFDQDGQVFAASGTMNYGDITERGTPDASVLYSNRWNTGIGEFGLLGDVAYSHVITTSRGVTLTRYMPFAPGTYTDGMSYIPSGVGYSDTEYDRTRTSVSNPFMWVMPQIDWSAESKAMSPMRASSSSVLVLPVATSSSMRSRQA